MRLNPIVLAALVAAPLAAAPRVVAQPEAAPPVATASPFGDSLAGAEPPATSPFRSEVVSAPDTVAPGEVALWRVVLRVPPGHYVYAERTRFEVLPASGVEILEVAAPAPETKHDTFLDEDVQ